MPFMIGKEPIRRTLKYLESGSMHLKSTIQIMALCYTTHGTHGEGFRFVISIGFIFLDF